MPKSIRQLEPAEARRRAQRMIDESIRQPDPIKRLRLLQAAADVYPAHPALAEELVAGQAASLNATKRDVGARLHDVERRLSGANRSELSQLGAELGEAKTKLGALREFDVVDAGVDRLAVILADAQRRIEKLAALLPPEQALIERDPRWIAQHVIVELGLTSADIARAVGTDQAKIEEWLRGQAQPPPETHGRLSRLILACHRVRVTFTNPDAACRWLHAPQRYLQGLAPADVIRDGRFDLVEDALEALESGISI